MAQIASVIPQSALEPAVIVIFGITGDLAQRKLLPALYHLLKDDLLHEKTIILGVTRQANSAEELLEKVELCVNEVDKICDPVGLEKVHAALRMQQMDLSSADDYRHLLERLNQLEEEQGMCLSRLYYLSIPPQVLGPIIRHLGEQGLNTTCQHATAATRLLVEKPFGYDVTSARELIADTNKWFGEEQIFRIDHYLAKETTQNILTFRLNNPIFTDIWNAQHVHDVVITASEQIGIEGRATFYEQTGALRDFIQSHLLQLLAIVAMEPPADLTSDAIHASKLQLLQAIQPIAPDKVPMQASRAQYESYRHEVNNPSSAVETYAALRLNITNDRWKNVPFIVRTGKGLAEKLTDIRIRFLDQQQNLNLLTLRIQPNEGIDIALNAKKPGFSNEVQPVSMDFRYQDSFSNNGHPDAYERVLVDAVRGDHTLFATNEEVMAAWQVVEAVIQQWSRSAAGLTQYELGTKLENLPVPKE